METTERTTRGQTFKADESPDGDQFPVCVYDAEGVGVHANDRIERVLLSVVDTTRTRRFGTVVGITVDWIIVRWDDTPGATFGVAVDVVENFCRVVIEDTTPDGFECDGSFVDDTDERELVPDFDEARENVRECGGF